MSGVFFSNLKVVIKVTLFRIWLVCCMTEVGIFMSIGIPNPNNKNPPQKNHSWFDNGFYLSDQVSQTVNTNGKIYSGNNGKDNEF